MYPEKWLDTTAEAMIYKYRVMTVVCFDISLRFHRLTDPHRDHSSRANTSSLV